MAGNQIRERLGISLCMISKVWREYLKGSGRGRRDERYGKQNGRDALGSEFGLGRCYCHCCTRFFPSLRRVNEGKGKSMELEATSNKVTEILIATQEILKGISEIERAGRIS